MKIYNKFLLYQNKLLRPYIELSLRVFEVLTYLASLLLILTVVYRYGYDVSPEQLQVINGIYKGVWILFLTDVFAHFLLSYSDTKKEYKNIAWILSVLLLLTQVSHPSFSN